MNEGRWPMLGKRFTAIWACDVTHIKVPCLVATFAVSRLILTHASGSPEEIPHTRVGYFLQKQIYDGDFLTASPLVSARGYDVTDVKLSHSIPKEKQEITLFCLLASADIPTHCRWDEHLNHIRGPTETLCSGVDDIALTREVAQTKRGL